MANFVMFKRRLLPIAEILLLANFTNHVHVAETITYVGVIRDSTDFKQLGIGKAGYWFPQFAAKQPVAGRPTGENARDALPAWAGPLNHATKIWDPAFWTRTFSQDGPGRSKGGPTRMESFCPPRRPGGSLRRDCRSLCLQEYQQFGEPDPTCESTPSLFFLAHRHRQHQRRTQSDNRLRARGNVKGVDLGAESVPSEDELKFNGVADIYTFRFKVSRRGTSSKSDSTATASKAQASAGYCSIPNLSRKRTHRLIRSLADDYFLT